MEAITRRAASALLLASLIVTFIITYFTNLNLLTLDGESKSAKWAARLNFVLIVVLVLLSMSLVLFQFLSVLGEPVRLLLFNWCAFIIALLVLLIDGQLKNTSQNITNKITPIIANRAYEFIDKPILAGILVICTAETFMTIYPFSPNIESYANGFGGGAIAIQVVIANFSFAAINSAVKKEYENKKKGGEKNSEAQE